MSGPATLRPPVGRRMSGPATLRPPVGRRMSGPATLRPSDWVDLVSALLSLQRPRPPLHGDEVEVRSLVAPLKVVKDSYRLRALN